MKENSELKLAGDSLELELIDIGDAVVETKQYGFWGRPDNMLEPSSYPAH